VLQLFEAEWQTFLTSTRRDDFQPDSSFAGVIHLPARDYDSSRREGT
jgi:hypothetical protein